ncbi:MAG: hypothetical protein R3Y07_05205 [Eubacteriales bacterium]
MQEQLYHDLCEVVQEKLEQDGVHALVGWGDSEVDHCGSAVAVVTLRSTKTSSAGFADYLGDRSNDETGETEELYGHRAQITFGLDLYAPSTGGEKEISATFGTMVSSIAGGISPNENVNLRLLELSCGDSVYDSVQQRLKRTVEAKCQVHLYTVKKEDQSFVTFEIKGEMNNGDN